MQPNLYEDLAADFTVANVANLGLATPSYRWEFGDGKSAVTTVAHVTHSYRDAVPADRRYATFQAKLSIVDGARTLVTPKTVSVWSLYSDNKQNGFVQPVLDYSPVLRPLVDGRFGQVVTITNREPIPLTLTSRDDELQYCDPAREPNTASTSASITVPALSTANVTLAIDRDTLTSDVCGAAVHLSGAAGSKRAQVDVYFDVRTNTEQTRREIDPSLLSLLNRAVRESLVADPLRITEQDLERLAREGKLPYPAVSANATLAALSHIRPLDIMTTTTSDVLGKDCRPGELPPRLGISCRPTAEDWVIVPPRVANALKGDILLMPGCGFIADLVRKLQPKQIFSHEYVVANNYYDLVHSTGHPDFPKNNPHPYGTLGETTEGIREDALKFGFPGTLTQTVREARFGSPVLYMDPGVATSCAPDSDGCPHRTYTVSGFNPNPERCKGDVEINRPIVLKPPPGFGKALRPSLHVAADKALAIRGHYRLFAYSRGDISFLPSFDAPDQFPRIGLETGPDGTPIEVTRPAAIWAAGTRATHSSQFIWTAFREAGFTLEGSELEAADFRFSEIDATTPDGAYFYRADERGDAAVFAYTDTYNKAYDEAGFFGELLTDAADDVANQVTNCFAFDRCSRADGDSTAWESPGDGRTTSPDDLLNWDFLNAPSLDIFRFNEPLIYRSGEWVRRHTWVADEGTGSVSGEVFVNGQPAKNATVVLIGLEETTDDQGRFAFQAIPAGTHSIEGRLFINGTLFSTRKEVTVAAGKTASVRLDLDPPEQSRRLIRITGTLKVVDTEDLGENEIGDFTFDKFCRVDPFERVSFAPGVTECVGGEVRVEIGFECTLVGDGPNVNVTATMKLFEGTACDTDDHEDTRTTGAILVLPGTPRTDTLHVINGEINSPDRGDATFTITNEQQP